MSKVDPIIATLKRAREARNLSQYNLSQMSGLGQPTISTMESGTRQPTLKALQVWANALGYEIVIRKKEKNQ